MKKVYKVADRVYSCSLSLVHSMFMGKWKGMIIWTIMENKVLRYGELKKKLNIEQKVSDKVLIDMLKQLENDGLVLRKDYKEIPPRVDYCLSKRGLELRPIFSAMQKFGDKYKS